MGLRPSRGERGATRHPLPENDDPTQLDQALLDEVARGNLSAFWTLWQCHRPYLKRLCLYQMGHHPSDAEDALSRAMLLACDKLPAHAAKITNLRAWLARLTHNLCIDIHKERGRYHRRLEFTDDLESVVPAESAPDQEQPEIHCLNAEMDAQVRDATGRLPPRLREAFVLRCLEGWSYDEIASHQAITKDNARKRVQQARSQLSRELGGYFKEGGPAATPPLRRAPPPANPVP